MKMRPTQDSTCAFQAPDIGGACPRDLDSGCACLGAAQVRCEHGECEEESNRFAVDE
jgi:hypothetical protein